MKEVKAYPPNWAEIQRTLTPEKDTIYCWGDTVYNPSGNEIPEDVWVHEALHTKQQEQYASPAIWWSRYLLEPAFRLEQELDAYAVQYAFVKEHYPAAAAAQALFDFALNLCSMYSVKLAIPTAEAQIRLRAKTI